MRAMMVFDELICHCGDERLMIEAATDERFGAPPTPGLDGD